MNETSYFPIVILMEGTSTCKILNRPEDLPAGTPFRVMKSKATMEDFRLIQQTCRNLADFLGGPEPA